LLIRGRNEPRACTHAGLAHSLLDARRGKLAEPGWWRYPPRPASSVLAADDVAADHQSKLTRYVALGDSFAANRSPERTPWTDAVADGLRVVSPALTYRNLARPGASCADIAQRQVPIAAALAPDVVTVSCGVDELLTAQSLGELIALTASVPALAARVRDAIPSATVVLSTYPGSLRTLQLPANARLMVSCALRQLNCAIRRAARASSFACADLALDRALLELGGWPSSSVTSNDELIASSVLRAVARQRRAVGGIVGAE
jgi:hypothetical protein